MITLSLSTNNSFEWSDKNNNGKWDVGKGLDENVVDMGLELNLTILGSNLVTASLKAVDKLFSHS